MKDLWKIVFAVFCTLLGVGAILLVSAGSRGQPLELSPVPSPSPLLVHVVGAVHRPGVYALPAQSRVQDAVQSAGGFLPGADTQALNLAAFLEDGLQLLVPTIPPTTSVLETQPQNTLPKASETALPPTGTPAAIFPIDINSASSLELELLPQIGPVRAARIVAYRQTHGPFKDVAAIQNVFDINPEVYAAIRDLIIAAEPRHPTPSPSGTP